MGAALRRERLAVIAVSGVRPDGQGRRSVVVRPAHPADAPRLGVVHVRSWQSAYPGLLPQDYLDGLDPAVRAERWLGVLTTEVRPGEQVFVVESGGEVVGFVSVGPSRDGSGGSPEGEVGEVHAIYLLPRWWGQGLGVRLLVAGLDHLRENGFRSATLWVLESNTRARRFYERCGWALDGAATVDTSLGFPMSEVRYRVDLRPDTGPGHEQLRGTPGTTTA